MVGGIVTPGTLAVVKLTNDRIDLRKIILAAFQFSTFLHSLG
jgi:hypothetical protein